MNMRVAVVPELGAPLVIEQRPLPDPGPGQVLVRLEASGLCHTDIHAAHGDWPVKPSPPFVPGHEGVGIVAEAGPDVDRVAVGALAVLGLVRNLVLRIGQWASTTCDTANSVSP